MTEALQRLNYANNTLRKDNENLINEKEKMTEYIDILEDRIKILHFELSQQTQHTYEIRQVVPRSSPSPLKIDKTGVHSPVNSEKPTVSGKDTVTLVLTVTSKDLSNPLIADTSSKNVGRIFPASFKRIGIQTLEEGMSSYTKDKNKKDYDFHLRRRKSDKTNIEQIVADSIKKLLAK